MRSGIIVLAGCLMGSALDASAAPAVGLTTVNYTTNQLNIFGSGFPSQPTSVKLGGVALTLSSWTASQIVAGFPSGSPPAAFPAGAYLLLIAFSSRPSRSM